MKSTGHSIVFREHPLYISLLFSISNCQNRCIGCHTPELQQDIGTELTGEVFKKILHKYVSVIQNVIFFGGDQHPSEIVELLKICKEFGLMTTLWTGNEDVAPCIKMYLDYLKTGPYIESKGGLNSPTTNQRYIEVKTGKEIKLYGK